MRVVQSYVRGDWYAPGGGGTELHSAVTGEPIGRVSSEGVDFRAVLEHARGTGGPALRRLTFHERALMLKALGGHLAERKEELYRVSTLSGATRKDAWIDVDGGIGVLATYGSKGRRELPDAPFAVDGAMERLSRDGTFGGIHIRVPLEGAAVQINAFNFPCWGPLEKLAPAILAGVPVVVKPATPTAYVTEALVRLVVESGILPEGALQLVAGSVGDLFDHLTGQDLVAFTGSSHTAQRLLQHPVIAREAVRFSAETDSLNSAILASTAAPSGPEVGFFVEEIARELETKAGQRCTAIRRALVPAGLLDVVVDRLRERLGRVRLGDPTRDEVTMGPLVSRGQRDEVARAVALLARGAERVVGADQPELVGADERGAFMAPTVFLQRDTSATAPHEVEAFGPVTTLLPYTTDDEALALARRGAGSLVCSLFSSDADLVARLVPALSAWHGRVLVVDETCARSQTGHGSPLPHLVHGGPGRAGGSEELGGMRSVFHHMQRAAIQGSPDMLTAVTRTYLPGATRKTEGPHPFRLHFEDLEIGTAIVTDQRKVTLEDIERFADLSGDRFYAHMDEEAAKASPVFEGRVAHGYFVLAAAAGLFVWPDPGPVLANYGLDNLRFTKPVYPGDTLQVALTCKQKTLRRGTGYGEVRWDTEVTNGEGEVVAAYDVLTMVATRDGA